MGGGHDRICAKTTATFTADERRMWPKLMQALRESVSRCDKSKGLSVNAAGNVDHKTCGCVVELPASLPRDVRLLADGSHPTVMWALSTTARPFMFRVHAVLSFAYPGKFRYTHVHYNPYVSPYLNDVVYPMTSDKLLGCDDGLKMTVRSLKVNMHGFPSLAELAHDCVLVNGLKAALEGLELAPASRPSEL